MDPEPTIKMMLETLQLSNSTGRQTVVKNLVEVRRMCVFAFIVIFMYVTLSFSTAT